MKAYILTTGTVFFLLFLAHIARVMVEGTYVLMKPIFLLTTLISIGLFAWAVVLYKGSSDNRQTS